MLKKILAKRQTHGLLRTLAFLRTKLLRIQRHAVFTATCKAAPGADWLPGEQAFPSSHHKPWDQALSDQVLSISAGNQEYLDAVSRGEAEGLAIVHGGKLVHYGFLMYRNKTTCLLGFGKRVGLIGNAFTINSYRGRGTQVRSVAARINMAQQAGLKHVISEAEYENAVSQRNIVRGGMELLGRMELVVLLNVLVIRYKRPSKSISLFGFCP